MTPEQERIKQAEDWNTEFREITNSLIRFKDGFKGKKGLTAEFARRTLLVVLWGLTSLQEDDFSRITEDNPS